MALVDYSSGEEEVVQKTKVNFKLNIVDCIHFLEIVMTFSILAMFEISSKKKQFLQNEKVHGDQYYALFNLLIYLIEFEFQKIIYYFIILLLFKKQKEEKEKVDLPNPLELLKSTKQANVVPDFLKNVESEQQNVSSIEI